MLQPQLKQPISPPLRVPTRAASHPAAPHTSRGVGVGGGGGGVVSTPPRCREEGDLGLTLWQRSQRLQRGSLPWERGGGGTREGGTPPRSPPPPPTARPPQRPPAAALPQEPPLQVQAGLPPTPSTSGRAPPPYVLSWLKLAKSRWPLPASPL